MRWMRSLRRGLHARWCATTQKCKGGRWGCCGLQDELKEGCVCFVRVQGSVCACQRRGTRVPPCAGWAQGARCRWSECECVCEPAGPALPAPGGTAGRAGGSRPAAARPTPGECRRAATWDRGRTGRGEPGETRFSGDSPCSGPVARGMQLCREDGGVPVWLGLLPEGLLCPPFSSRLPAAKHGAGARRDALRCPGHPLVSAAQLSYREAISDRQFPWERKISGLALTPFLFTLSCRRGPR